MLFKGGRDPHKMGGFLEIFILVSEVVAETKMDDFLKHFVVVKEYIP